MNITACSDSDTAGNVLVQIGRPHLLRLRPPVDARTLELALHGIRIDRLCSRKPIDLTVTVEEGDIVVREAGAC